MRYRFLARLLLNWRARGFARQVIVNLSPTLLTCPRVIVHMYQGLANEILQTAENRKVVSVNYEYVNYIDRLD